MADYIEETKQLPRRIQGRRQPLARWTKRFRSAQEQEATSRISVLESQIIDLRKSIDGLTVVVDQERELKHLYAGTGSSLVSVVMQVLRELGLKVVEGPPGRADLLIWGGHRLSAAEVKGLDNSAREANFRQAERWAAEVNSTLATSDADREHDIELKQYATKLAELGIDLAALPPDLECRGLMVIGAYRQRPLDERPRSCFPDQVVRAIGRSKVYALTGLDLFCIAQRTRLNAGLKPKIVEELLCGSGVREPEDWTRVILDHRD